MRDISYGKINIYISYCSFVFNSSFLGHCLKTQKVEKGMSFSFHKQRSCHELSASLFSVCLSVLWIGALGPSILPIGEPCVIVWVCVCMCACCPQNTLLSVRCCVSDTLSGFYGSLLVSLVLCLLHLFTPHKHSQIYYLSPSRFSLYLSYLLLTSPDLSF